MYQIIMNENRSRNDILILLEFMPIIQSILKTRDILMWFLSVDNFVETLVSAFDETNIKEYGFYPENLVRQVAKQLKEGN